MHVKKRALISVYDKAGVVDLARELAGLGHTLLSTGGTAEALRNAGLPVVEISHYTGHPEIKALAGNHSLQWQNLGVKKTQDWTEHHVVFNTLENEAVSVMFGVWGSAKGRSRPTWPAS